VRDFKSIEDFIRHLASIVPAVEVAAQRGVHEGGSLIQAEAQREIGHYQSSAGPFPDWAPLADTTLNGFTDQHGHHHPGKVELGFAPPDNPLLRTDGLHDHIELSVSHNKAVVGVPDEIIGDGTPENPVRNIGDVARWQEFGDSNLRARSFLGRAAYLKAKAAAHAIGHAVFLAIIGRPYTPAPRNHFAPDDIPF
jgi:hypothetical protein